MGFMHLGRQQVGEAQDIEVITGRLGDAIHPPSPCLSA